MWVSNFFLPAALDVQLGVHPESVGFFRFLMGFQCHTHPVDSQLVIGIGHFDAYGFVSFQLGGQDAPQKGSRILPPGTQILTKSRMSCRGFSVTWVRFCGLA